MIAIDVHLDADAAATMARDVRAGLSAYPKELAPKYFYDERGSQLFEQITELPEYYPTRAEREILSERSAEILAAAGGPGTLVELGSGSAAKTRHLLSAMRDAGSLETYVPVDISEEITHQTASCLVDEYPGLDVRGLVCDFEQDLERIPAGGRGSRLIAFLGGTIGNLYPRPRQAFLERIAALLGPGRPAPARHRPGQGARTGSRPPTTTPPGSPPSSTRTCSRCSTASSAPTSTSTPSSTSPATTPRRSGWTSACARSPTRRCAIDGLDLEIAFAAGEEMRTEISTKFTRERLESVYAGAGLEMSGWFTDAAGDYALSLARLAGYGRVWTAGTCWVMQWMLPPPSRISRRGDADHLALGEAARAGSPPPPRRGARPAAASRPASCRGRSWRRRRRAGRRRGAAACPRGARPRRPPRPWSAAVRGRGA